MFKVRAGRLSASEKTAEEIRGIRVEDSLNILEKDGDDSKDILGVFWSTFYSRKGRRRVEYILKRWS